MTGWAEQQRDAALELDFIRQQAALVVCPECSAPVGESCRNVNDGGPLAKLPHRKRSEAAGCLP
jgi:hypothetical protein